jgi:lysophospholipase L1-like esterase/predicted small lipoprotein YifL
MRRLPFVLLVTLAACGGKNPNEPPPPPVGDPSISCPANVTATVSSVPTVVIYTAPTATGGTEPTSVSCDVASGASLPAGTTPVTCTVTDAIGRRAVCGFNITVALKVYTRYTTYWAFGDSLTEGEVSSSSLAIKAVDTAAAYPTQLRALMAARYAQQTVTVENHGRVGERADDGADRLRAELLAGPVPDVLLLIEGTNEMLQRDDALVDTIVPTLRVDIDEARARGVKQILLATFPPVRAGIRGSLAAPYITPVNTGVRNLAVEKGVTLVDLYEAMRGEETTLIGDDGLHPTVAGYRRMAETFLNAIKQQFELASPPSLVFRLR